MPYSGKSFVFICPFSCRQILNVQAADPNEGWIDLQGPGASWVNLHRIYCDYDVWDPLAKAVVTSSVDDDPISDEFPNLDAVLGYLVPGYREDEDFIKELNPDLSELPAVEEDVVYDLPDEKFQPAKTKVLTGAVAKLIIRNDDGTEREIIPLNNVSWSMNYDTKPVFILGKTDPVEYSPGDAEAVYRAVTWESSHSESGELINDSGTPPARVEFISAEEAVKNVPQYYDSVKRVTGPVFTFPVEKIEVAEELIQDLQKACEADRDLSAEADLFLDEKGELLYKKDGPWGQICQAQRRDCGIFGVCDTSKYEIKPAGPLTAKMLEDAFQHAIHAHEFVMDPMLLTKHNEIIKEYEKKKFSALGIQLPELPEGSKYWNVYRGYDNVFAGTVNAASNWIDLDEEDEETPVIDDEPDENDDTPQDCIRCGTELCDALDHWYGHPDDVRQDYCAKCRKLPEVDKLGLQHDDKDT